MREPVQMLWIGSRLSALERLSIASFLANGHRVDLYAYAPVEGVPAGTTLCDAREIFPESEVFTYQDGFGKGSPAAFANQFRYKLLLERGGLWSDTDMVCLRPLDFLSDLPYLIATQRMPPATGESAPNLRLNVCIMKTPAASPAIRDCLEECLEADRVTLKWGVTGPDLATRAFVAHGLLRYAVVPDTFCSIDFWKVRSLVAAPLREQPGWFAIHLWNEMWRASHLDKDARYPADCAYETLRRRYAI